MKKIFILILIFLIISGPLGILSRELVGVLVGIIVFIIMIRKLFFDTDNKPNNKVKVMQFNIENPNENNLAKIFNENVNKDDYAEIYNSINFQKGQLNDAIEINHDKYGYLGIAPDNLPTSIPEIENIIKTTCTVYNRGKNYRADIELYFK